MMGSEANLRSDGCELPLWLLKEYNTYIDKLDENWIINKVRRSNRTRSPTLLNVIIQCLLRNDQAMTLRS